MARPPMALSHSMMTALACPWSFQQRMKQGFYGHDGGYAAQRGTIFHRIPELYIPELARLNRRRDYDIYCDCVAEALKDKPDWLIDPLEKTIQRFYSGFELNKRALSHQVELRLAVSRARLELVDCDYDEHGNAINLTEDIITARIDYRCVTKQYKVSFCTDWKSGIASTVWNAPAHDAQSIHYAAMDFWSDPRRELVHSHRWGVAAGENGKSSYTWKRDAVCEIALARIERSFGLLDMLWGLNEIYPDVEYPVMPNSPSVCLWCPVANRCPLNAADLGALMAQPIPQIPRRRKVA